MPSRHEREATLSRDAEEANYVASVTSRLRAEVDELRASDIRLKEALREVFDAYCQSNDRVNPANAMVGSAHVLDLMQRVKKMIAEWNTAALSGALDTNDNPPQRPSA